MIDDCNQVHAGRHHQRRGAAAERQVCVGHLDEPTVSRRSASRSIDAAPGRSVCTIITRHLPALDIFFEFEQVGIVIAFDLAHHRATAPLRALRRRRPSGIRLLLAFGAAGCELPRGRSRLQPPDAIVAASDARTPRLRGRRTAAAPVLRRSRTLEHGYLHVLVMKFAASGRRRRMPACDVKSCPGLRGPTPFLAAHVGGNGELHSSAPRGRRRRARGRAGVGEVHVVGDAQQSSAAGRRAVLAVDRDATARSTPRASATPCHGGMVGRRLGEGVTSRPLAAVRRCRRRRLRHRAPRPEGVEHHQSAPRRARRAVPLVGCPASARAAA